MDERRSWAPAEKLDLTLSVKHLWYQYLALLGRVLVGWGIFTSWEVFLDLAEIRFQEGETLENALRRFKRKVQQEDIIKEVKKHSFYLKPGEKKRIKQALARKRSRKKVRREPVE